MNATHEVGHAGEAAAPDSPLADLAEPAFDLVDPGRVGRREMHVEARTLGRLGPYLGVWRPARVDS